MIPRPNAIMFVKPVQGKSYVFVYVRDEGDHYWGPFEQEYVKTTDFTNLDPFVNWFDFPPDCEQVHPVLARRADDGGWLFKPYDTYNTVFWEGKPTTLNELSDSQKLFSFFGKVLDAYNITDEELLEELNVGRIDKWTLEELENI